MFPIFTPFSLYAPSLRRLHASGEVSRTEIALLPSSTVPTDADDFPIVSFAAVPVPVLLTVAALTLIFGTDHPNGKWEDRFQRPAAANSIYDTLHPEGLGLAVGHTDAEVDLSSPRDALRSVQPEKEEEGTDGDKKAEVNVTVRPAEPATSEIDVAVNQPVTMVVLKDLAISPLTWLPSLAYLTTFGFELAMDANLANLLYDMYQDMNLGQTKAGYIAATYGLLNVFSRAFGRCHCL